MFSPPSNMGFIGGFWRITNNGMFMNGVLQKIWIERCIRRTVAAGFAFCFLGSVALLAQTLRYPKPPNPKNGKQIFNNGCIACHGADGKGTPQTIAGFERPDTFPDFTRCDQTAIDQYSHRLVQAPLHLALDRLGH